MALDPLGQRVPPFVAPGPGDQAGDIMRGGQGRYLPGVRLPSSVSTPRVATAEAVGRSSPALAPASDGPGWGMRAARGQNVRKC